MLRRGVCGLIWNLRLKFHRIQTARRAPINDVVGLAHAKSQLARPRVAYASQFHELPSREPSRVYSFWIGLWMIIFEHHKGKLSLSMFRKLHTWEVFITDTDFNLRQSSIHLNEKFLLVTQRCLCFWVYFGVYTRK